MATLAKAVCRVYTISTKILTASIFFTEIENKPENSYIIHKVFTKVKAAVSKKNTHRSFTHSKNQSQNSMIQAQTNRTE